MIPKRFDEITKADIDALVANGVAEGRTIDYKRTLPGGTDDEKREFLADVSSFANAAGGDIVYGVEEDKGIPTSATGLQDIDPDAEILRLDNIIRSGIDPRVPAVQIKAVVGFSVGPAMVLRVPKSWSSPHMVTFKNLSRFFSRTNAGKCQLDVTEIRSAFFFSEAIPERMKRFRDDRLARIVSGETPVPMSAGGKVVLHLLPISAFAGLPAIDMRVATSGGSYFAPIVEGAWSERPNVDGFVTFWPRQGNEYSAYTQLFRSGAVEVVDGFSVVQGRLEIAYEERLIHGVQRYWKLMQALGTEPPIVVMLSMVEVKGITIGIDPRFRGSDLVPAIDRDVVLLPDLLVEDMSEHPAKFLKPIFDAVWQSAGHPRSCNYDQTGNWKPQN